MDKISKQSWIDDTLRSIDRIGRAEANAFLYSKVFERLNVRADRARLIKPQLAWVVSASLILLLSLNVVVCFHFENKRTAVEQTERNAFGSEYFPFINNNSQF